MKQLLILFFSLAIGFPSLAQPVYYQINILQSPSAPLDDHPVWIKIDPPSSPAYVHYGRTINGVYDTLPVPANSLVTAVTYDCNGNSYAQATQMPAAGNAVDSIILPCPMNITSCNAGFQMLSASAGQSLHLADTSKVISVNNAVYRYVWSYGDTYRDTLYASGTTVHNYASAGGYNVCLEISIEDTVNDIVLCSELKCKKFAVGIPTGVCASPILLDTVVLNQLYTIAFTAQTGGTHIQGSTSYFEFFFGDGTSAKNTTGHITHSYPSGGNYNASLIEYRLNSFNDTICVDTISKPINVNSTGPCTAGFGAWGSNGNVQVMDSSFFALASNSYARFIINYGDGIVDTTTANSSTHTYATPGTYPICYILEVVDSTSQNVICSDTVCHNFTVSYYCNISARDSTNYNSLDGWFRLSASSGGMGITRHLSIDFGDGTSMNNPVQGSYFSHTYPAAGTYSYNANVVIVHTATGDTVCSDNYQSSINVGGSSVSCNASFSYSVAGPAVNLSNQSSNTGLGSAYVEYLWVFGDGDSSSVISPSHTYQQPGTYSLCLQQYVKDSVTNQVICYSDSCVIVQISGGSGFCQAQFQFQQKPNSLIVEFEDTILYPAASASVQYLWTFGDGDSSTLQRPIHPYSQPGTYTACLMIMAVDSTSTVICTDTICRQVTVQPANATCRAQIYPLPDGGNSVKFLGAIFGSPTTPASRLYQWDFGDGTSSKDKSPTHSYANSGTYQVCLTIYALDSLQDTLCSATACETIQAGVTLQNSPGCSAKLAVVRDPANPYAVSLIDSSSISFGGNEVIASYLLLGNGRFWRYSGAGTPGNFTANTHYDTAGTYSACAYHVVTDTLTGQITCVSKDCHTVHVAPNLFCNASYIVDTANSFFGNVYIWNMSKPADTSSRYTNTYHWDFGDGNSSNLAFPTHTYSASGVYPVCLTITSVSLQGDSCTSTYCDTLGTDSLGNLIYKNGMSGFTLNVLDPNSIGLPEHEMREVELYPNPATEQVFLQWNGSDGRDLQYSIADMKGRVVLRGTGASEEITEIDVAKLRTGMYLVTVESSGLARRHFRLQVK